MPTREQPRLEICILAGGLSTRLGRDKARVKLDGMTMLARIRAVAGVSSTFRLTGYGNTLKRELQPRVRVLRQDAVPRCGPLGGIVTALRTTQARAVLFLACDMPLITPTLLRRLFRASADGHCATFTAGDARAGFPLLLPVKVLPEIEEQISRGEFSLQALEKKLLARRLLIPAHAEELMNVNTPEDVARVELALRTRPKAALKRPHSPAGRD